MEKELVPYKQSMAIKELGFDEPCFGVYLNNDKITLFSDCKWEERTNGKFIHDFMEDTSCVAPTFSQAFRWFREKYRLDGKPEYFLNDWYCFIINDMKEEDTSRRLFTEFPSYEEAELECLKKLIEVTKRYGTNVD